MSLFKHRHFQSEMIIWAVRWSGKYSVRYRELKAMSYQRGVHLNHRAIER